MPSNEVAVNIGPFPINRVAAGDCFRLAAELPDDSISVVVTSPPYWGQRVSQGMGEESDPRTYVESLVALFKMLMPKIRENGIVWINLGDSYNTPVNWRLDDRVYSGLGVGKKGLNPDNSAYVKPRSKRRAFLSEDARWLRYGNLLALPYRLILRLCDEGYFFRGEVIWRKKNPMPEGRCRRPQRQHEPIYLLSKSEAHGFRVAPPVGSVWEFPNEKISGLAHYSRFPEELPRRCIDAFGTLDPQVVVLDPFSGSGTTGIAALRLGCSYVGFEIDEQQVTASNERLRCVGATDAELPSVHLFQDSMSFGQNEA